MMVYEYTHLGRHLDVFRWQVSSRAIGFTGSLPVSQYHVRSVLKSCEFWPMHAMKKHYASECKLKGKVNKLNVTQKMGSMEKQQLSFFIFLALNLFNLFLISEHVALVEL